MDQQKVDMFIMSQTGKFPPEQLMMIRERLMCMPDDRWMVVNSIPYKDPTLALILSILLGSFGIDRFYIGDVGLGIGKLLTAGGCGVWTIIDWFFIMKATREKNFQMLMQMM